MSAPTHIREIDQLDEYAVVIVGGGAAGIGAAIGARQVDADIKILLVEKESCLGGALTHRGVVSFCGLFTSELRPRQAIGAIWTELRTRLLDVRGTTHLPSQHRGVFQVIEPEAAKLIFEDVMNDYRIDVLLNASVVGATRHGNSVHSVGIQCQTRKQEIAAKAFVDCSGDCNLAYHSGASTRYGNHGRVQVGSLATRFSGLNSSANATSAIWRDAILKAKANDPLMRNNLKKNSSVLLRLPQSGDIVCFLASASYDATSSSSITKANISGRRQAQQYLEILRRLPGQENMYLVSTGPNFGTRESRHINARYCLLKQDFMYNKSFEDCIAIGAWGIEYHDAQKEDWASSFIPPPAGTFEVPLRCLQSVDTENLFVAGRCVDGDQYAGSAVRVMGTALATGQAAGVAAALCARSPLRQAVNFKEVQSCLRKHGAFLDAASLPYMHDAIAHSIFDASKGSCCRM